MHCILCKTFTCIGCCLAYVCVGLITPDMEFLLATTTMQHTVKQLLKRLPVIAATELFVQLYTAS